MSATSEARLNALDRVLDAQQPSEALAEELFSVVDALAAQPTLRRALTDPSTPDEARTALVGALFGGKVSQAAVDVLTEATRLRWPTSGGLTAGVERQATRAALTWAQAHGALDQVEEEVFKLGRLVDADRGLRAALGDRMAPLEGRQQLLDELLQGKVQPVTRALARRAVAARNRTFDLTLEEYLKVSAALRQRAVATVEVARPLSADQVERLKAALSRQVGRDVSVNVVLNPTVIGGVRVSLGDEVIEGTVAARLHDAQRKLS